MQLYRDLLAPWGLTYQQLLVLALLWEEGASTPGRIGESLMLDSGSVAGLLRRMQRDGLIDREVDVADRRRVLVSVTPKADELRSELGFLEECVGNAVQLEDAAAQRLISELHDLRAAVTSFPRPEAPSATGDSIVGEPVGVSSSIQLSSAAAGSGMARRT